MQKDILSIMTSLSNTLFMFNVPFLFIFSLDCKSKKVKLLNWVSKLGRMQIIKLDQ